MKKEKVTQLKIEEAHGETFVVDDKKSQKEIQKKDNELKKQQKEALRLEKKKIKIHKKLEKDEHKQALKEIKRQKRINYYKKLDILRRVSKERKAQEKLDAIEYDRRLNNIYKKRKIAPWLRLDNAGTIYPPAKKRNWNFVYRITAVTKDRVEPAILQKALDDIIPRFPSFNVCLKSGLFWNYFERAPRKLLIQKDVDFPCQPFDLSDTNSNLIRVIYDDYKISFECFHALSDGRGSLMFLNSLLARYFTILGEEIEDFSTVLSYKDMPTAEELEDSFQKHYNTEKTHRPKEKAAYKIKGNTLDDGVVNSIVAEMSVSNLKEIAKKHNCSLTVLLSACVGYVAHKNKTNNKKPVRISVPIDCRTRFPSKTLRNFSSYINVEIDGENLTLDDCIEIFKREFTHIDKNFIQSNINANVKLQKNFFIKIVPLFLKSIIMKSAFNHSGENYQTFAFSNIGVVSAPKEFNDLIDRYEVNLGRSGYNTKSMGLVSFGDKLVITFSSNIEENQTEKDYFNLLSSLGANIKIYSNRRDIYGTV